MLALAVLAAGLATAAAGCGSGGSATADVETGRLAAGRALFRQICAGCHTLADAGAHGYRLSLDTSSLRQSSQRPELARIVIEIGDSIMPDWKGSLSVREIETLKDYLVAVTGRRTRSGDGRRATTLTPRPNPWRVRPPAQRFADGDALFREMCAGCHTLAAAHAHGERVNLDAALAPVGNRATVVRHALKYSNAMPDWTRRLSPSEIDALVRYVSSVAGRER
jgi:sulfite dehydrogenase